MVARRSSLAVGAGPMLSTAGAVLAAAFLRAGLAEGDSVVLTRLMSLLTVPLATLEAECAVEEKQYAEWVGIRARVALLEVRGRPGPLPPSPTCSLSAHMYAIHASAGQSHDMALLVHYHGACSAGACPVCGVCIDPDRRNHPRAHHRSPETSPPVRHNADHLRSLHI